MQRQSKEGTVLFGNRFLALFGNRTLLKCTLSLLRNNNKRYMIVKPHIMWYFSLSLLYKGFADLTFYKILNFILFLSCPDERTKMKFLFIALMEKKKSENKSISNLSSFPILPVSSRKAVKRSTSQFSPKNKSFINYVFCRNWAVRNSAGTRLDSFILVNKHVTLGGLLVTFF